MRALRYVVCDVFTDRPLAGNQLAVFTQAGGLRPDLMQALAREMNFSETVFVQRPEAGGHAKIRIFTPHQEIPFAGHPTLGSAFVLGEPLQVDVLRLETARGIVPVRLEREGAKVVFGWMDQPLPKPLELPDPAGLLAALGVERSVVPLGAYDNGAHHAYVMLADRPSVAQLSPDFKALARVWPGGVSVFAGSGTDYKTRCFVPAAGIDEDPATGSAAGPLAVHLRRHGLLESAQVIRLEQGEELKRPSVLYASAVGTPEAIEQVRVGGAAVVVARGEFRLPLA